MLWAREKYQNEIKKSNCESDLLIEIFNYFRLNFIQTFNWNIKTLCVLFHLPPNIFIGLHVTFLTETFVNSLLDSILLQKSCTYCEEWPFSQMHLGSINCVVVKMTFCEAREEKNLSKLCVLHWNSIKVLSKKAANRMSTVVWIIDTVDKLTQIFAAH